MSDQSLSIKEIPGGLRITIPMGLRERVSLLIASIFILGFGVGMSVFASLMLRHTGMKQFWWIPLILGGLCLLLFLLVIVVIWSIPGTFVEFDGQALSAGNIGYPNHHTWPREAIKSIGVSRLPMVPIATVMIHPRKDQQVRIGYWRKRELTVAIDRLRGLMGIR
ncbi:MAG: hypothetical protein JO353_11055 [Phycisphaerae bacterium]|nr:hypothetical protein [Phycisphaerae bacterium]